VAVLAGSRSVAETAGEPAGESWWLTRKRFAAADEVAMVALGGRRLLEQWLR
jgi:hypothetical protein